MGLFKDIFSWKSEPAPDVWIYDDKIVFTDGEKDVIVINNKGFFFNGEKVNDKGKAYKGFKNWLKKADE